MCVNSLVKSKIRFSNPWKSINFRAPKNVHSLNITPHQHHKQSGVNCKVDSNT